MLRAEMVLSFLAIQLLRKTLGKMMIVGVGVDLVFIPRIARLLQTYGHRFPRRILHESELISLKESYPNEKQVEFLAGRYVLLCSF